MLVGLQDPQFLAKKTKQENELLKNITANEELKHHAEAWHPLADVQPEKRELIGGGVDFRDATTKLPKSWS